MNWLTLISTIVGAVIGIASTMLADRARFRREITKADRDARRQLYAEFLISDAAAHDTMRIQALKVQDPNELRISVHEAFQGSEFYSVRYQMTVLAPPDVVQDSEETFRRLRKIRRALADGAGPGSEVYKARHEEHEAALRKLRNSMRADLGQPALLYADETRGELRPGDEGATG